MNVDGRRVLFIMKEQLLHSGIGTLLSLYNISYDMQHLKTISAMHMPYSWITMVNVYTL